METEAASAIASLEESVQRLEGRIETLESELHALRNKGVSMRGQTRCPLCGCTKVLTARKLAHGSQESEMSLAMRWTGKQFGKLACYVCTKCGLVEWYIPDLADVDVDGKDIHVIEAPPTDGRGPYR